MLCGRDKFYGASEAAVREPVHDMAQKKERADEISGNSGNALKYNKITNLQGNPKKVALFFARTVDFYFFRGY